MEYTIKESNQTVYSDKLGLTPFSTIYSEGASNTIYLGDSVAAAPSLGTNYVYGIDKYNLLQYFKSPGGITVDAVKGFVKNGWGGTDYFSGITGYQGSGFSDYFRGSSKDEIFYTGGGADTVIGGGGWDRVTFYSQPSTDFKIEVLEEGVRFRLTEIKYPQNVKVFEDIDQIEFGDRSIFAPIKTGYALNAKVLGIWQPIDSSLHTDTYNPNIANSFWGNLTFGSAGLEGMVAVGWAYSGFDNKSTSITPVNSLLIEQTAGGSLRIANQDYLSTSRTNGGGSVIVADFNRDGRDDIFLAAHNESPFVTAASTVYLSDGPSKFKVVTLNDQVMAHDAQLYRAADGNPRVIIQSFGPMNNSYSFDSGSFAISPQPILRENVGGMSVAVADFDGQPGLELIAGDVKIKGGPFGDEKFYIGIYKFDGTDLSGTTPLGVLTPYMTSRDEFKSVSSHWGVGVTHVYRLWVDDFNHDGKPDILAGTSMWKQEPSGAFLYPSMLQMFQNSGGLKFADVTDSFNKDFPVHSAEVDYNLQIRDIDRSGINSYLSSGPTYEGESRQQNFILLNDGTGKLYEYKRKEFIDYWSDVKAFARTQGYQASFAEFHPYLDGAGRISFAVEMSLIKERDNQPDRRLIVELPLKLDPKNDFELDVSISNRNESVLMRTWAGNDKLYDSGANALKGALIDGGLGLDVSQYSGKRGDYEVQVLSTTETLIKSISGAVPKIYSDTLKNFERLMFSDISVALDISGGAGQAYRIYKAAFNRSPDTEGLGYWIAQMDLGMALVDVSARFIDSKEFRDMYGSAPTNADFLTKVYTNVLGRAPDQGGFDWWLNEMNTNPEKTRAKVLADFSESAENLEGTAPLIATGILFEPWGG